MWHERTRSHGIAKMVQTTNNVQTSSIITVVMRITGIDLHQVELVIKKWPDRIDPS